MKKILEKYALNLDFGVSKPTAIMALRLVCPQDPLAFVISN